jgi:hypothetical protein
LKKTNTKIILENDFKCFPPKPLTSSLHKPINIEIKKYSRIIQFKKHLKIINELAEWKLKKTDIGFIRSKLISKNEYDSIQNDLILIPDVKIALIFLKILSPVFAILITMRRSKKTRITKGLVDSFNKNTIYYLSAPEEHVVSHENIHILQHKKFIDLYKTLEFNPYRMIDKIDAYSIDKKEYLKYVCQQCELEARLHELIVSFYRRDGRLLSPLKLSSEYIKSIELINKDIQVTRSSDIDFDLKMIFYCFIDIGCDEFFVDTLIPLLYSNLISYYGDDFMSYRIKSNLFNNR